MPSAQKPYRVGIYATKFLSERGWDVEIVNATAAGIRMVFVYEIVVACYWHLLVHCATFRHACSHVNAGRLGANR